MTNPSPSNTATTAMLTAIVRLALLTGMRRGELLGLRWARRRPRARAIPIQQTAQRIQGHGIVFRQPKTRLSRRSVALSPDGVDVLRKHRRKQAAARLLAGPAYQDHDLVFATGLGTPLEPGNVRREWLLITKAADLEKLRIHDLRHAHALADAAPRRSPQGGVRAPRPCERECHLDTYSHVLPGLQEAAAAAIDHALEAPAEFDEAR